MDIAVKYYICTKCDFRTTLLSAIDDHLLVHSDTKKPLPFSYFDCFDALKPLKCTSCDFTTESLVLLRYHITHNHDQKFALKAKLKSCKKCGFCTHSNYLWIIHRNFTCKGKKVSKGRRKREKVAMKKEGDWFLCNKCDFRTIHSGNVRLHIIRKHTPLEEIDWQQCTQCPAKFKTLTVLRQHEKLHISSVERLYCTECDYSTPYRRSLVGHFNGKHAQPEEIKWAECGECGTKFKGQGRLNKHLMTHSTKEKQYECDQCTFKTHYKDSLKFHIVNRHLKDDEIKWYNCQHCDFKAKRRDKVITHIQSMHSESVELVQCPHCSYKTKRNGHLKLHIMRVHEDSALTCDLCDFRTKYERTLKIHKNKKHGIGDVKQFKCEHCDFTSNYKAHMDSHMSLKHYINRELFKCKQCDYKTHSKHYLCNHMTRMHRRQNVIITCENCSFVTTTERQLQLHIFNKHTERTEEEKLNCAHCTYFCFNKGSMSHHLRFKHNIGDNIRWYNCDKCDYKNPRKNSLVSHMYKVHNEGKLLECDQCAYQIGSPYAMKRHKKKHETN